MLSRIARRAQATSAIKIADGVKNASVRLPHKEVTKEAQQAKLLAHGKFIMDALPKYVQDAQVTFGNELEIMICPTGVRVLGGGITKPEAKSQNVLEQVPRPISLLGP